VGPDNLHENDGDGGRLPKNHPTQASGVMPTNSGLALLPHGARDPGSIPGSGHCLGVLLVLRLPPTVQKMCKLGELAMLNSRSV